MTPSPNAEEGHARLSPIRLIFLGRGLTTEIDHEDADLIGLPWRAQTFVNDAYGCRRLTGSRVGRKRIYLAREITQRMGFDIEGKRVDHINGDTLDNRRCNLRVVGAAQNARNTGRLSRNNTSGFQGVCKDRNSWVAYIKTDGRQRTIGRFATADLAHKARLAAELVEWGIEPQRARLHG